MTKKAIFVLIMGGMGVTNVIANYALRITKTSGVFLSCPYDPPGGAAVQRRLGVSKRKECITIMSLSPSLRPVLCHNSVKSGCTGLKSVYRLECLRIVSQFLVLYRMRF